MPTVEVTITTATPWSEAATGLFPWISTSQVVLLPQNHLAFDSIDGLLGRAAGIRDSSDARGPAQLPIDAEEI